MLSYEEKMFRDKPYTKCYDCIQGNSIKCKKCMALLVNNIIKEKRKNDSIILKQKNKRMRNSTQPRQKEEELQIKTCYGRWMQNIYERREKDRDPVNATIGCWPHKKAANKRKMVQVESPRFESWAGRLLSRFSSSEGISRGSFMKGISLR